MSEYDDMFRTGNPFPSSPVVQLRVLSERRQPGAATADSPVSVDTDAIAELRSQVTEYLDHSESTSSRGRAVALIGDLGLGKSHLAREVVATVRSRSSAIPVWVIDQPTLDLGTVYRNQLTTPQDDRNARAAFEAVVAGYHAYVTADVMESDTSGRLREQTRQEFIRQLRQRDLDSRKVVQHFGIDEELIHRHLRAQLREITDHRKFAVALSLLLDRRFNSDVWDWLAGNPPAPSLMERGITARIDGTAGVLDALAVYGFVNGQVGEPYVLILDALEDVLEWPPTERAQFINGFEMLVNTYTNQGGLLVLCTQPEPWSRLPPGLHERVLQIWPDRMSGAATAKLVSDYVRRRPERRREDVHAPFSRLGLEELTEVSNGVPRQILKICRRAWQIMERPQEGRTEIDASVIHDAVRKLHEQRPVSDVRQVVERVLADDQWHREAQPEEVAAAGNPNTDRVDYWVRVGDHTAVAILVVRSILVEPEVRDIAAIAQAARGAFSDGDCPTLVLVNGLVSQAMRDRVVQYTGTAPLVVTDPGFPRLLGHAVARLAERLGTASQGSALAEVRQQLDAVSARQAALLAYLQRVGTGLTGGTQPAAPRPPVTAEQSVLPDIVRARFARASEALEALAGTPAGLRQALGVDETGLALVGPHPQRLRIASDQLRELGLGSVVGALLEAFRSGVTDWLRSVRATPGGPTGEQRRGLFVICRGFEITMEVLPPFEGPESFEGSAPPRPDSGTVPLPPGWNLVDRPADAMSLAEARATLAHLAESVQRAALRSVTDEEEAAGW